MREKARGLLFGHDRRHALSSALFVWKATASIFTLFMSDLGFRMRTLWGRRLAVFLLSETREQSRTTMTKARAPNVIVWQTGGYKPDISKAADQLNRPLFSTGHYDSLCVLWVLLWLLCKPRVQPVRGRWRQFLSLLIVSFTHSTHVPATYLALSYICESGRDDMR